MNDLPSYSCERFFWRHTPYNSCYEWTVFDSDTNQSYRLEIERTFLKRHFKKATLFVLVESDRIDLYTVYHEGEPKGTYQQFHKNVQNSVNTFIRKFSKKCTCKECSV